MERVQPVRHKMKEQPESKTIGYPTATVKFRALPELCQSEGTNFSWIFASDVKGNDDDETGSTM